jgi:hypothetical protein
VDEATCAACDFNVAGNGCKRDMEWTWRGDYAPANKAEFERAKMQIAGEKIDGKQFLEYEPREQAKLVQKRVKEYSHKVYKASKETQEEMREDTVCMRENPFYIDTVKVRIPAPAQKRARGSGSQATSFCSLLPPQKELAAAAPTRPPSGRFARPKKK